MNKDKGSKSEESTPRNKQDNKSDRQLISQGQCEGPESWINREFSVGGSARRRPSSWDNSDNESLSTDIISFNHNEHFYTGASQKQDNFVVAKINDIKAQYFKNLDAVKGLSEPRNSHIKATTCKNVEEKGEIRSKMDRSDRRQSPARIRRRTQSSSSASTVFDPTVKCSSSKYTENFHNLTPENYQYKERRHQSYCWEKPSLKTELELDSNHFFDHIFTELGAKRIELVSLGEDGSNRKGRQKEKILDLESCSKSNIQLLRSHDLATTSPSPTHNLNIKALESFESQKPITFVYTTSRKLSKILEMEETKKSQEEVNFSEQEGGVQSFNMSPFLWANTQKPSDDMMSPFSTSIDGEKNMLCWTSIISFREKPESSSNEAAQLSPKNFGSLGKVKERKPENHSKGTLSERFHNLFPYNKSDNIVFLTKKAGITQLNPNSEKREGNNNGSFSNNKKTKDLDEIEREASWEILEMENVNSEDEKVEAEENSGLRGKNNSDPGTREKNLGHVKTQNSEVGKNFQGEEIPNLSEEAVLLWSEGSTPRISSRHSLQKSSPRESEPDFLIKMEASNLQPQTSRSSKIEEIASARSSRESSFRLKDKYNTSKSGEMSKESSQRTNLSPEIAEDKKKFLNIDLEQVCSDTSTSTESNNSFSRTLTQEIIKDSSFQTNSSGLSAKRSHTSEPTKNRSLKQIENYFPDNLNPNRFRRKGSKTERHSKSKKMLSQSLINSEKIFENLERKPKSLISDDLKIWEKQTSENFERRSSTTTAAKKRPSKMDETRSLSLNSSLNACSSCVSEVEFPLKDFSENLESTILSRQIKNYIFYDDVTMTVRNFTSDNINSNRSEKTSKKLRNDEEMKKGLCETKSEETMSMETKDVIQEYSKGRKKDDGTVKNIVTGGKFLRDTMSIEESEKFLNDKNSLSPTSAKATDNELTISMKDIFSSMEKMGMGSDKSGRENEREGNPEDNISRRARRMSNESLSITCEKWEKNMSKVKLHPGQTCNETAVPSSEASSEANEKHTPSTTSGSGSCIFERNEGNQTLNEELKSINWKISFRESLGHETFKESMASKPVSQVKFNREMWNKLIEAFEITQDSNRSSENKFPGFPSLNQKEFRVHDREETQNFFLYEPDELNESEDILTLPRRFNHQEMKSCLRSSKDRELKGNKFESLVTENINLPLEHSEGRIMFKNNAAKTVREYDLKRRNFEIGEFGDGHCWHDGKPDISEPGKPQHYGDGNQERRNNWKALVLRLKGNNEEKETESRRHTWIEFEGRTPRLNPPKNKSFSDKENNVDLEPISIWPNLNYSKSENCLSKMRRQQRDNESEHFETSISTGSVKKSAKRKSNNDSISNSNTRNCERKYQLERSYSSDERDKRNPRKKFGRLDTVTSKMENRKLEKEAMNLNIFLAEHKKEKTLVKGNNWLIVKDQEGKESKQQKEKIRKLKKKLKKCEKLNSPKKPLDMDENATERTQTFVPILKLRNTDCLQNFYKRLFSICCLTSNSSAATSV